MTSCRLFIDEPAEGTWNMAVDDALLDAASRAGQGSTLRFYQWAEPTLSLGYFQRFADRGLHPASAGCAVVRRTTGGGAILHDHELTYSFVTTVHRFDKAAARWLYELFHQSLLETLADFRVAAVVNCGVDNQPGATEPWLCFLRRCCGDVLLAGKKICGSAQRRQTEAILQHGSILLRQSTCAPELAGIYDLTGVDILPAALIAAWLPRLEHRLGQRFTPETSLTIDEREYAVAARRDRFATTAWNQRK